MPGIALSDSVVMRARSASAARKVAWCDRSPFNAAATGYCIGPGLQSRPSASFLMAASASSSRGVAETVSHPVRQPGARYALERLDNEMIGASGSMVPRSGTGPSKPISP